MKFISTLIVSILAFSSQVTAQTCSMIENKGFERMFFVEDFAQKTDTQLNALRELTFDGDLLKFTHRTIKPKRDGSWEVSLYILCEHNDNNWSPCGHFYGKAVIHKNGNKSLTANLILPWTWNRGIPSTQTLDYTCR